MKNKRSKSDKILKQRLKIKQEQLTILQDKVNRSKPILQVIYDKVKNKQKLYHQRIMQGHQMMKKQRSKLCQYKKLYEESTLFLKKGGVIDQFRKQPSNYLMQPNKFQNREKRTIKASQKLKNIQKQIKTSKSIYQQYKERINKTTIIDKSQNSSPGSGNPEIKNLIKETNQLATSLSVQIDGLKKVRQRSQNKLKKSFSAVTFRANPVRRQPIDQAIIKQKLHRKQSQKLKKIK